MNARSHSRSRSLEQEPGSLQEEIWGPFRAALRQELQAMVEQALEEELTEHLAARSHERTAERRGYRNGHYRRCLLTRHGEIPDLTVPRAEEGGVEFPTLGRYQGRQLEIDMLERTFREYRRRTRPMQIFPNPESAERIYSALWFQFRMMPEERDHTSGVRETEVK